MARIMVGAFRVLVAIMAALNFVCCVREGASGRENETATLIPEAAAPSASIRNPADYPGLFYYGRADSVACISVVTQIPYLLFYAPDGSRLVETVREPISDFRTEASSFYHAPAECTINGTAYTFYYVAPSPRHAEKRLDELEKDFVWPDEGELPFPIDESETVDTTFMMRDFISLFGRYEGSSYFEGKDGKTSEIRERITLDIFFEDVSVRGEDFTFEFSPKVAVARQLYFFDESRTGYTTCGKRGKVLSIGRITMPAEDFRIERFFQSGKSLYYFYLGSDNIARKSTSLKIALDKVF